MPTINDRIGSQNVIRVLSNASAPPSRVNNLLDINAGRKDDADSTGLLLIWDKTSEKYILGNDIAHGLNITGLTTFTRLKATGVEFTGVTTAQTLSATTAISMGSTSVISHARQLQNIASLDATTTATIESAIVNAPNTFTNLEITGISTFVGQSGHVGLSTFGGGIDVVAGVTTFREDIQFKGAAYDILWDQATSKFKFNDSAQAVFGSASGGDLKIYHQSGNSTIKNETGQFRIAGNDLRLQSQDSSEDYLLAVDGGSVSLFFNDVKRLETSSTGVNITDTLNVAGVSTFNDDVKFIGAATNAIWDKSGSNFTLYDNTRLEFGSNTDFEIWHGGAHTFMKNTGGDLRIRGDKILLKREDDSERYLEANVNQDVKLFYNGNEKFATISTGATVTGDLYVSGDLHLSDDLVLDNITGSSLKITGISTFDGNIDANGNLDVDGQTDLDDVNIARTLRTYSDVQFIGTGSSVTYDKSEDELILGDTTKLYLGTGKDLAIYHELNENYIKDTGSGNLNLSFANGNFNVSGGTTYSAVFNLAGSVQLFHNGANKLETISTGATVTGDSYVSGTLTAGLIDGGSY